MRSVKKNPLVLRDPPIRKRILKNGRQSKLVLLLQASCFRFVMVINDCRATGFLTLVIYYHTFVSFADKFCGSEILENEPLRALQQHILRGQTFDIITKAIFADGMDEFIHSFWPLTPPKFVWKKNEVGKETTKFT